MDTFLNSAMHISFLVLGVLLIILILVRKGEGGGLGGALGGGMSDTVFGTKAAKALDKLIAVIAGLFLLLGVLMYTPIGGRHGGFDQVIPDADKSKVQDKDKSEKSEEQK